jgi:hypothetical protein
MKFNTLRSIAHNVADSLASGIGLMIGLYEMDIFGEASRSKEGFVTVDFLAGTSAGGEVSPALARAISLYADALESLCERQGVKASAFRTLGARYSGRGFGRQFVVTIEDQMGRHAVDTYFGSPGKRARYLDPLGRVRTQRRIVSRSHGR